MVTIVPLKAGGGPDYDLVLTTLMAKFYPSGMLGIGLTALMASFMSGMAGNVTAFNTVFTYDIYQSYIRPKAPDSHYLWVGRITTVAGVVLSIGTAYLATQFNNMMDFLQLIFAFVNAPLFATFLLGMFWKRTTGHGGLLGLAGRHQRRRTHLAAHFGRRQRRIVGRCPYFQLHHGAKLLDRHHLLDHLLHSHCSGQPRD